MRAGSPAYLAALGHRVVGIDSSLTLLHHARTASTNTFYTLSDGAALPFSDNCFDLAVAYRLASGGGRYAGHHRMKRLRSSVPVAASASV